MKVMVLDDEAIALRITENMLKRNGYEVEAFSIAKEAINWFDKGNLVDVILSDVMLPGMDGFQFIRHIKKDKRLMKIPVILCTSLNDKAAVIKGITAGAMDYIAKPIQEAVLMPKLERAIAMAPGAVLVVDDEEVQCNLLKDSLKREGFHVLTALSGKEAIETLEKNKIMVVLSDIKMPDMSGIDLLGEIKKRNPKTAVLLLTGYPESYNKADALAAGADGYIKKPYHNIDIITTVGTYYR